MKIINSISRIMSLVATGLVVPMMLLTVVDVFSRFAFRKPILGTAEFTSWMMACLFLGVAWCAVQGRHIMVDLVIGRFSPRVQAIVDSIALLVGLGIIAIMAWRTAVTSMYMLKLGYQVSSLVPVPEFPFYLVVTLSWVMLWLVMVTLLIQKVAGVIKG